jgi:L-ascorbate metabolism protein UlaG (beta-lactamase superfamily)
MIVEHDVKSKPKKFPKAEPTDLTVQLIRNATMVINIDGKTFLVDPMFSEKSAFNPIPWTNEIRNPTVELPFSKEQVCEIVQQSDAVLLTHLHPDHWDEAARAVIPKSKPIICQTEDVPTLVEQGYSNLTNANVARLDKDIGIIRIPAQHGHGEWAEKMAPASGYVIQSKEKTIYLTGDSVWYEGIEKTIENYSPDVIIVNAGGARFQFGEPITMTTEGVLQVAQKSKPDAKVIVVHMEAVNHCYLTRKELVQALKGKGLSQKCFVPNDGESLTIA